MMEVLIIDDEERDRYLVKQRLRNLPLLVRKRPPVERRGFAPLANTSRTSYCWISGWRDLSGFEVLDELKRLPETATIPVIIATSRHLTRKERSRLLDSAVEIIDKENLSEVSVAEAVRRILKDTAPSPAGVT